jgi:hypothetical protein
MRMIAEDALGAERQILSGVALAFARYEAPHERPTLRVGGSALLRALHAVAAQHRLLLPMRVALRLALEVAGSSDLLRYERAGMARWPLSTYVRWKFQRRRQAQRKARGLDA